jgi:hypothetical protein
MNESHPMKITRPDLYSGSLVSDLATLFNKGTLPIHPGAKLKLTGNGTIAGMVQDRLERSLGVPAGKIQLNPIYHPQYQDSVDAVIIFFPPTAGKQKVTVEFKLDLESLPIQVEFEVSPDGTYVEEIKAQWSPLKKKIRDYALAGRVKNIKIATKVEGTALYDREASGKFETALKAKLKTALSADVLFPGNQMINIEFYGAAAIKLKGDEVKPIFEGGLMISIPHNLL